MPEITTSAPPAISTPAAPAAPALLPTRPTIAPSVKAPPVATAVVDADAAEVGKWAKLARQARETKGHLTAAEARASALEAKVAELEALRPVADRAGNVDKLIKDGKLAEAMSAAGVDLEKAFAQWVEANDGAPAAAGPPKELLALQAKYDAIEARLKADDDAKAKLDEDAKKTAGEAGRVEVIKGLSEKITGEGARWVRCAKDPASASEDALGIAVAKVQAMKRPIAESELPELYDLALDAVEAEYKATSEKFYIAEVPRARSATVPQIRDYIPKRDSSPVVERKVAVTLDGQRGSLRGSPTESRGRLTEAEAKAKALASIRTLTRGK